ncbi:MAG: hypothetical protein JXA30_12630 [Deltaproteobacteria bacterium]|nr:hypothetical protein [Deltaproteobacteria bacterium]
MGFSEKASQGFALAAISADDPEARLAQPGLSADAAVQLMQTARDLAALDKKARRQQVVRITRSLSPALGAEIDLPRRALSLLAPSAPQEIALNWLADAPRARPGFDPEPGLRAALRGVAEKVGLKRNK